MPMIYVPDDLWQRLVALARREHTGAARLALEALRVVVDLAPGPAPALDGDVHTPVFSRACDCGSSDPWSARYGHQHLAWCDLAKSERG